MDDSLQATLIVVTGLAAIAWVASVAMTALSLDVVRGRGEPGGVVATARRLERWPARVALAAAVLVAIAGSSYLWSRGLSSGDEWWVGTAIGAWLVAFFGSTILRVPQLSAARRRSTTEGVHDEDVQWRIRQVDLTARGELLLLLVAFAVVVAQPS